MKRIAIFTLALIFTACASNHYTVKEEFKIDIKSQFIEVGVVEAQFDKVLGIGGLKTTEVTVNYYPREDVVCLLYRTDFITYHQFWSKRGRDVFISALSKYKEDYTERNLTKNSRKNKMKYGVIQSFLSWQGFSFSMRSNGHPDIELGYYFKEKSPFFTINQRSTTDFEADQGDRRTTPDVMIYMTIAQAEETAALFDPEYLNALAGNKSGVSDVIYDDY